MSDNAQKIVWQHMQSAAQVMDAGLESLREQVGDEAYKVTSAAIKAGCMMQIITTLSLAGMKALSINLIAPNGESVNLGTVEFVDGVALN